MSKYASDTAVPAERSRVEIEKCLQKYGATGFFFATEPLASTVGFRCHERIIKFVLPMPVLEDFEMAGRRRRKQAEMVNAHAQAVRQRWRCLALAVKAKLEVVESGISSFESEFLAHIMMPDGRTVGDHVSPRIAESYKGGANIPLLAAPRIVVEPEA